MLNVMQWHNIFNQVLYNPQIKVQLNNISSLIPLIKVIFYIVYSFLLQADRAELLAQLKDLKSEGRQVKSILDEKIKELEPLQQALGKLRPSNNAARFGGLCSSEEELNELV